LSIIFPY
jgi:hypothetical protein